MCLCYESIVWKMLEHNLVIDNYLLDVLDILFRHAWIIGGAFLQDFQVSFWYFLANAQNPHRCLQLFNMQIL